MMDLCGIYFGHELDMLHICAFAKSKFVLVKTKDSHN